MFDISFLKTVQTINVCKQRFYMSITIEKDIVFPGKSDGEKENNEEETNKDENKDFQCFVHYEISKGGKTPLNSNI